MNLKLIINEIVNDLVINIDSKKTIMIIKYNCKWNLESLEGQLS